MLWIVKFILSRKVWLMVSRDPILPKEVLVKFFTSRILKGGFSLTKPLENSALHVW